MGLGAFAQSIEKNTKPRRIHAIAGQFAGGDWTQDQLHKRNLATVGSAKLVEHQVPECIVFSSVWPGRGTAEKLGTRETR
eukprot:2113711-Amphidinium_carterae.1